MRATTFSTPKVSRATRAARMLELSPLLTAAKACARWMPAAERWSRSKPMPVTVVPLKSGVQLAEARRVLVDDGDRVAGVVEGVGERRPHSAATHDDDVHESERYTCAVRRRATGPGTTPTTRPGWATSQHLAFRVEFADVPMSDLGKRILVGRALSSEQLGETLLPKRIALPVFASDALSSNAYATQEILLTLAIGGAAFYSATPWIAAAVVLVFFVVVASYRQNVHAYPSGGGDYEVVSTNLGARAGRVRRLARCSSTTSSPSPCRSPPRWPTSPPPCPRSASTRSSGPSR